jgi:hypothetical protein
MYYRNANCAVVVYDITQAVSSTPPHLGRARIRTDCWDIVVTGQGETMGEGTPTTGE